MLVSLVVSTYNAPRYLSLCLESILNQTRLPDEIVVADDGSGSPTREVVESFGERTGIPILHIWQEDNGFRLAEIRNKAIARSLGDYIIQIDGDILLHAGFVSDHLALASPGSVLQGSRVMLEEKRSEGLVEKQEFRVGFFSGGLKRRENAIRCLPFCRYLSTRYRNRYPLYYARGCNMSFFFHDFIAVNGYDESFTGWGHEDSDLTLRMLNRGFTKKYLKFAAVAYHLFHDEKKRITDNLNKKKMDEHLRLHTAWCEDGIDKYLKQKTR
ncbi:MAG: glycosyltransferase family 2 protein [Tannerellaceae bacterium]|jgi:glycosyltransferase involved in cell wall biosynthesis|nr:glycosyltransferase family 2 protein [Tannerellaceae bacterium]